MRLNTELFVSLYIVQINIHDVHNENFKKMRLITELFVNNNDNRIIVIMDITIPENCKRYESY